MARGGARPGAGRPKRQPDPKVGKAAERLKAKPPAAPERHYASALEFAMAVINDPEAHMADKIRLAIAALPFQHPKLESTAPGKRELVATAAREAAGGRVAPPAGPKNSSRFN